MDRDQLIEHLRFAAELGVTGVSRDASWRVREVVRTAAEPGVDAEPEAPAAGAAVSTNPIPAIDVAVVSMAKTPQTPAKMLAMIQSEIGPACTRCKLHTLGRKQVVFGVGNHSGAPDVCRRSAWRR
ncbi:MAG: hypothetical protein U0Q11_04390 [Vicinamibacterales bacterium]